jgi:Fur family transcriptional regulator, ferric uptake regulator
LTNYILYPTIENNSQLDIRIRNLMEFKKNAGSDRGFGQNQKPIKKYFHKQGLKCTPQRLAVLSVLKESPKHFSITEIHKKVKKILPGTGLATIYRALETLIDLGLVIRVHLEDGCQSFAVAPIGHQHRIVCIGCNRVVDFAECPIEAILGKLSRQTGFAIQNHFLQLFGKCRTCQKM